VTTGFYRRLPPRFVGWVERNFICEVPTRTRLVALTFDDGPDPVQTPRVLEILAREGHSATFFCIGRNARLHPAIVAETTAGGHEIGNHTYSHLPLLLASRQRLVEEVRRADWILSSISGGPVLHFRPPMGWATPAVLRWIAQEGYRTVLGSIYPADPRAPDADTIVRRTVAGLAPGRIVILHDGSSRGTPRPHTVAALPEILRQLEARGLRGVSVRELIAAAARAAGLTADPATGTLPGDARGSPS
jgi:peptidoglycan/xylan/chitin deacetylase (PgdA/CDA1 family)